MSFVLCTVMMCSLLSVSEDALNASEATSLAPGIFILKGAVNTGVFIAGNSALLIDCCETATPERLRALGVDRVEMVCMTQHRRPNAMGAYRFVEEQGAQVLVSEKDRSLFEGLDAYWTDPHNRWHLYHAQPGPQVLPRPLPVARTLKEGDVIEWRGFVLRVMETPGATQGSLSYLVEVEGKRLAFTGDLLYGPGQLWDLYSLQKGFRKVGDYHGFLGMREPLIESLHRLALWNTTQAIPSHGAPFDNVAGGAALLEERLNRLFTNYVSVSALNHYFPEQFEDMRDDASRMHPAEQLSLPAWVRRVDAKSSTSFVVLSDSGAALLIDCGNESILNRLDELKQEGTVKSVEGCWVTHYHDDHVDALSGLTSRHCPIMANARMAEILEYPLRYYLPCIAPTPVTVARKTEDGESWKWHEFTLTAFHFPGQTLYHGGLLVEGHGEKAFFAGDSGAPTGLDDYCAGNRTFLGAGRGSRRCLNIWRSTRPDYIINEHQDKAFCFTGEQLDYMEQVLLEREALIKEMTPWDEADFAIDEHWIRAYPYEQAAAAGDAVHIQVHVTNHSQSPAPISIRPSLPPGWQWEPEGGTASLVAPARTDGWVSPGASNPDVVLTVAVRVPQSASTGLYVIPFSVDYREWKLGAVRHAIVRVQ